VTLVEIRNAGHRYARKPQWNKYAALVMPPKINGYFGPWCTLIDPAASSEVIAILFYNADDGCSDWEPMESVPELPVVPA
jgi:hypothetical protein